MNVVSRCITCNPTPEIITTALNYLRIGQTKHSWQMTLDEFLADNGNPTGEFREYLTKYHTTLVAFARERGLLSPTVDMGVDRRAN